MAIEKAILKLKNAGFIVVQKSENLIIVLGDPKVDEDITSYSWGCYLELHASGWIVMPPPILAPGPGSVLPANSFDEAVEILIYMYEKRHLIDASGNYPEQEKKVEALFDEFKAKQLDEAGA